MKKIGLFLLFVCLSIFGNIALADTFGTGINQFTIDFVTISGDAGKANGTRVSPYTLSGRSEPERVRHAFRVDK
jgi:hypothetical protein